MYIAWLGVGFVVGFIGAASGQTIKTIKTYDTNGNYRGAVTREGDRWVHRDSNANVLGYNKMHGDKTTHYDINGNRRSYTIRTK